MHLPGIGVHVVFVAVLGAGEGVVHGDPAVFFLVVLEHGEVHHPQRCPAVFKQAVLLAEFAVADLDAQCADGVVDDLFLVGTEERSGRHPARRCASSTWPGSVVDVLHDGRLQAVAALGHVVDLDVGQALGAVDLDELGVGIDLAAADAAAFAPPGTRRATTRPPFMLAAPENTLKSTSFITSVSSVNSSFTRRSGLSEPKRCSASW
jgi:hypothetical protein